MQIDARQATDMSFSDAPFGEVIASHGELFIKDMDGGGVNLVTGYRLLFDPEQEVTLIPGRFIVDV